STSGRLLALTNYLDPCLPFSFDFDGTCFPESFFFVYADVNSLKTAQCSDRIISRVRDSETASAHECLYVNFLSEMEPKKLIEALEEEGWIIARQKELNQFEKNKV
ncbi:hypothetical protein Tco_1358058, partial [Tanacetum coccineum]